LRLNSFACDGWPLEKRRGEIMELTEKQKALLQNLKELLVYGNNELAKVGLKRKRTSLKKRLLFFMMGATQSYAESILKIITPTQEHPAIYDKPALVLLRSLTENFININYIHACNTQANAAIYQIHYLQDTVKFANRYKCLMLKYPKSQYPDWDLTFGFVDNDPRNIKKPADWDKFIKKLERQILSNQRRYKLSPKSELPSIEKRCVETDNYLKAKGKLNPGNSLEKLYVTYYPYFSGIAHLTAPGLNTFIKSMPDGSLTADIDAPATEIETIVPVTYPLYFSILKFFLQRFNVYNNKDIKKYSSLSKTMRF